MLIRVFEAEYRPRNYVPTPEKDIVRHGRVLGPINSGGSLSFNNLHPSPSYFQSSGEWDVTIMSEGIAL